MAQTIMSNQRSGADLGRCGLHFCYQPCSISASEAAMQAGQRLLMAASLGDSMQVVHCAADGADPNFADPSSGETALHRAAQHNHRAVVQVMASLGADMDRSDRAGRMPLFIAASRGCIDTVQELLLQGASLFPPQPSALTAAHSASAPSTDLSGQRTALSSSPTTTADSDDDAALLELRHTCPLATAAAAARWPVVAALLTALPPGYQRLPAALRSLRFLVWALASHRAFPREVIARLPPRLPRCVVDAVRPAHLASTPLVLATGNDQQQLMQWLLQQGADPELGAPLLLCAGRFCRGARTCCVSTLLRRGAAPHVAWADNPADSPLRLAAAGDCFTHVHCLVAYGADVDGESARVRQALYAPAPWEDHLDTLLQQYGSLATQSAAELLCPCGQQHARWPGLWPPETEADAVAEAALDEAVSGAAQAEVGSSGNSCHNRTPADDAWYRLHREKMEQLQDGKELAECRKAVDELWRYGCSAVVSELGGAPSAPHSLMPQRILEALMDVAGGWLVAAARCRQQRILRADLYDRAVAAGRALLDSKRIAALAALSGVRGCGAGGGMPEDHEGCLVGRLLELQPQPQTRSPRPPEGLAKELKMEILALAGLAPAGIEPRALTMPARPTCNCLGCSK